MFTASGNSSAKEAEFTINDTHWCILYSKYQQVLIDSSFDFPFLLTWLIAVDMNNQTPIHFKIQCVALISELRHTYHQFASNINKTSRHTWARTKTEELWASAADVSRQLDKYPCSYSVSYHELITGQCLTKKTLQGGEVAACQIVLLICGLMFNRDKKIKGGRSRKGAEENCVHLDELKRSLTQKHWKHKNRKICQAYKNRPKMRNRQDGVNIK